MKGPYIDTFYSLVYIDLVKMCQDTNIPRGNLKIDELNALPPENNHNLIIKPADKGGSIVILERKNYKQEAHRLLSDQETYTKLWRDSSGAFSEELSSIVQRASSEGILSKKEKAFLSDFYLIPYFYYLPEIHKDPEHPPGRPIIASMDSVTSSLS